MKLSIRKTNLMWSDALARHAEHRVARGLGHVRDRVGSVLVRLADVNGPRGGADKQCLVTLRLANGRAFTVNELAACPYRAIDGAVLRLRRAVTDRIRRDRERRRRTTH